jgi:hypothetical protein
MASLKVEGKQFADVVLCFLHDKLSNPDEVIEPEVNEEFNAFMEILQRKGIRPLLLRYYVGLDPRTRSMYKRIKGVFRDDKSATSAFIRILQDERVPVKPKEKSRVLKKILRVVKKLVGG